MATMNDMGHVEYMGYIITLSIYWVLSNIIQYRLMSYGVIQYVPLDNTIIFREVHIANIRIVYIISNTVATRHIMPFDQLIRPSLGTSVVSGDGGGLEASRPG
jgi:hypothetical protein